MNAEERKRVVATLGALKGACSIASNYRVNLADFRNEMTKMYIKSIADAEKLIEELEAEDETPHHVIVVGTNGIARQSYQFVVGLGDGTQYSTILTPEEYAVVWAIVQRMQHCYNDKKGTPCASTS